MNHLEELAAHLEPLAAPLPAPSPCLRVLRPRVDAEAIEAMAAARATPFPHMCLVSGFTPRKASEPAPRLVYVDEVGGFAELPEQPPRAINWGFAFLLGYLLAVAAFLICFAWSRL